MKYGKLSEFITKVEKLGVGDYGGVVPQEYWNEYLDVQVTFEEDFKTAMLPRGCVYPCVLLAGSLKKGRFIGHHKIVGNVWDNDSRKVYFVADKGKLTRDVKEALILWMPSFLGDFSFTLAYDVPEGYQIFETQFVWNAQERIDKQYPLPRKVITKKERELTYQKFDGHCAYCGKPITMKEMQVDHIKSHMTNCGKDDIDNYYPACATCNRIKSDLTIEEFRQRITRCGQVHRGRKKPIMASYDQIAINYGIDKEDKPIQFYFEKKGD